jgi:hypothetical protein
MGIADFYIVLLSSGEFYVVLRASISVMFEGRKSRVPKLLVKNFRETYPGFSWTGRADPQCFTSLERIETTLSMFIPVHCVEKTV